MWEIAVWFAIFLFSINGFLVYIADAVPDYDLISPFTNTTYTPPTLTNLNNTFTNITGISGSATNSTAVGSVSIWDVANFSWNATIYFVQFLYGSVTGQFFISFGLPPAFLIMLYGLEIIFTAITVLHFWRGIF